MRCQQCLRKQRSAATPATRAQPVPPRFQGSQAQRGEWRKSVLPARCEPLTSADPRNFSAVGGQLQHGMLGRSRCKFCKDLGLQIP